MIKITANSMVVNRIMHTCFGHMSIEKLEAVVAAMKAQALASSHLGSNAQANASVLVSESITAATVSMPEYAHNRAVENMRSLT